MAAKFRDLLLASLPFLFVLVTWQLFYLMDVFPNWLIPSPQETAITFYDLSIDGTLINLLVISSINTVPAFLIGLVLSVILGTFIGLSNTVRKILFPFIATLYPIPSLAWIPLIILLCGFTRQAIWAVIFISTFLRVIYNVIAGVRGVKQNWILSAKNFGFNKYEIIYNIILPGALPQIITGARLGFGSAWRSLIGAEMLVVTIGGLGEFIWMSQWLFDFSKVIVGIIFIGIIGVTMETLIFAKLEEITLLRWGLLQEDS
jgi:ABC-type nitrate/sulfonate/bicarbonate transport system permease component